MTFVSLTLAATSGAPLKLSGLVSGLLNTSQQVGGAIGLAVLSVFANSATTSALSAGKTTPEAKVAGYHYAFHASAGFALAASLVALVMVKNRLSVTADEESQDGRDERGHGGLSGEVETVTS